MGAVYAMRVNLSIAIVAMVKRKSKNNSSSSINETLEACPYPDDYDPGDDNDLVIYSNNDFLKKKTNQILG